MLKRFIGRLLSLLLVGAALAGCGDSPSQTGEFATVDVTASSVGPDLDSDVSVAAPDTGAYLLTSTPYTPPETSGGGIAPSEVAFIRAWVTLARANSWSPELPNQYRVTYFTPPPLLGPGESFGDSVELVTLPLKEYLKTLPVPAPASPYQYWATISFEGVERSSDREETITTFNSTKITFTGFQ